MNGGQCSRYRKPPDGMSERLMTSWFNNIRASSLPACSDSDSDSDVTVCDYLTTSDDSTEDEVYVELLNCVAVGTCCCHAHGGGCCAKPRPLCCHCANHEPRWDVAPPRPPRQWEENFHVLRDQWSLVTMSHSLRTYQANNGRLDEAALMPRPCCGCNRNATTHMVSVASTVVSRCSGAADYPPIYTCASSHRSPPCLDDRPSPRWRPPCSCQAHQHRPAPAPQTCNPCDLPCSCARQVAPCVVQLPCQPRCHCGTRRRPKRQRTINIQLVCKTSEADERTASNVAGAGLSQDMGSFSFPRSAANEDAGSIFQSGLYRPIEQNELSLRSNLTGGLMNENASLDRYGPNALGGRDGYYGSAMVPGDLGYGSVVGPNEERSISRGFSRRGELSMNGSMATSPSARNTSFKALPSARPGDSISAIERTLLSDVESATEEKSSNESIKHTPSGSASASSSTSASTSTVEQEGSSSDNLDNTRKRLLSGELDVVSKLAEIRSDGSSEDTSDANNSKESIGNGSTESMDDQMGGKGNRKDRSGVQGTRAGSISGSRHKTTHGSTTASGERNHEKFKPGRTPMESSESNSSTSTSSSDQPSKQSLENNLGDSQESISMEDNEEGKTRKIAGFDGQVNEQEIGTQQGNELSSENDTSDSKNSIQSNGLEGSDGSRNDSEASKESNDDNVDDGHSMRLKDLEEGSKRSGSQARLDGSNIDDRQRTRLKDLDGKSIRSVGRGSQRSRASDADGQDGIGLEDLDGRSMRSADKGSRRLEGSNIGDQSIRTQGHGSRRSNEDDIDVPSVRSQGRVGGRSSEYDVDGESRMSQGRVSRRSNENDIDGQSGISQGRRSNENGIDGESRMSQGRVGRRSIENDIDGQLGMPQGIVDRRSNENDIDGQFGMSQGRVGRRSNENDIEDQLGMSQGRVGRRSNENDIDGQLGMSQGRVGRWSNENDIDGQLGMSQGRVGRWSNENDIDGQLGMSQDRVGRRSNENDIDGQLGMSQGRVGRRSNENDIDGQLGMSQGRAGRRSNENDIDGQLGISQGRRSTENDIDGQSLGFQGRRSRWLNENDIDDDNGRINSKVIQGQQGSNWSNDIGLGESPRGIRTRNLEGERLRSDVQANGINDTQYSVGGTPIKRASYSGPISSRASATNFGNYIESDAIPSEERVNADGNRMGSKGLIGRPTNATQSVLSLRNMTPDKRRRMSATDVGSEHSSLGNLEDRQANMPGARSILEPNGSASNRGRGPGMMGGNNYDLYPGRSVEGNFSRSNRLMGTDRGAMSNTSIKSNDSVASTLVQNNFGRSDTSIENNEGRGDIPNNGVGGGRNRRESYLVEHNRVIGDDINRFTHGGGRDLNTRNARGGRTSPAEREYAGRFVEGEEAERNYAAGMDGNDIMVPRGSQHSFRSERGRSRSISSDHSRRSSLSDRSSRSPSSGRSSPGSVSSYHSSRATSSGRSSPGYRSRGSGSSRFDSRSVSSVRSSASERTDASAGEEENVGETGNVGEYVVESYYGGTGFRPGNRFGADGGGQVYVTGGARDILDGDQDVIGSVGDLDENGRPVAERSVTSSGRRVAEIADGTAGSRVSHIVSETGELLEESSGVDQDTKVFRVCAVCLLVLAIAVGVACAIYFKLFSCHNWFATRCARKEYCFFFKGADPPNRWWRKCFTLW